MGALGAGSGVLELPRHTTPEQCNPAALQHKRTLNRVSTRTGHAWLDDAAAILSIFADMRFPVDVSRLIAIGSMVVVDYNLRESCASNPWMAI